MNSAELKEKLKELRKAIVQFEKNMDNALLEIYRRVKDLEKQDATKH